MNSRVDKVLRSSLWLNTKTHGGNEATLMKFIDLCCCRMDRNYDSLVKVLLCGDSGVGKTCLISQFTDGQVRKTHITTIG